ncbi:acyl-CoA dehydrogenase family protein [Paraburkholderia aromaticivorans]|uniref:acyl-CoA dehydrogenase family protein n=1 Tax=Paraburkholderia aromaticivorans TaxID=2026199 RepID=UPI001455F0D8|nr:acyl-CoA dehydrogenase family protein [Paraburkholderia aromaticivorans]
MLIQRFKSCDINKDAEAIRGDVRAFLAEALRDRAPVLRAQSWMGFDAEFSRKLGERGWIGMTWPKRYGGGEKSAFARYVVIEELLAAGAPVSAHWIADRQSGPLLLRFGSDAQKEFFLPAICRGELFFCIGMSEPNAGSDLASIRTTAQRVDGGWRLNGSKLWTTNAHHSHYMITLVRTSGRSEDRHGGLSQFIVDLKAPGVTVRPIVDLTGEEHFNEVFFEDVFIAEDRLVGDEGQGWQQVTAELAYERSGPERFLSSFALFTELIRRAGDTPSERQAIQIGRLTAQLVALRRMSLSVAGLLDQHDNPAVEAACVKDLGVGFEQDLPEAAQALFDIEPCIDNGTGYAQTLAYLTQMAPSFSLRGGTREILRGIIARGLGLR